jgi:hypothetical protein
MSVETRISRIERELREQGHGVCLVCKGRYVTVLYDLEAKAPDLLEVPASCPACGRDRTKDEITAVYLPNDEPGQMVIWANQHEWGNRHEAFNNRPHQAARKKRY